MTTLMNLRAHAPGAPAADPADGEHLGPDQQRIGARLAVAGQPASEEWQGITLHGFNVAPHPGLHRPSPAPEPRATSRFVARTATRLVLWSCSKFMAGMRSVARQWREARIIAKLARLDDATLKDLGICRCEIEYLARTPGTGKWRA